MGYSNYPLNKMLLVMEGDEESDKNLFYFVEEGEFFYFFFCISLKKIFEKKKDIKNKSNDSYEMLWKSIHRRACFYG